MKLAVTFVLILSLLISCGDKVPSNEFPLVKYVADKRLHNVYGSEQKEKRVAKLENEMAEMKTDVAELKTDVAELKTDVAELKTDVAELKTDVAELKTDVAELKTDVAELKVSVSKILEKLEGLENGLNVHQKSNNREKVKDSGYM